MPDEGQVQGTTQQAATTEAAPTAEQIQNMNGMAMAFDDPSLIIKPEGDAAGATNTSAATTTASPGAAANTNTQIPATPDYTPFVKEAFNVDTVEEAKKQWVELQTLKTNPPKPEPIKFENEQSEKVFNLLKEGKVKEVSAILAQQDKIDALITIEATKDTAEEIIKTGMQLKNPKLTPNEISFQYKEEYLPTKEPVQRKLEDDDEFAERMDEWKERCEKLETKRVIAAKMIQPELEAAKIKIQLPNINKQEATPDKDYEAYKASLQSDMDFEQKVIVPAIHSLTEDKVKMSFEVNDPNNQMQFGLSIVPDKADFEAAKQDALSLDKFIAAINYDKDGKFTADNLALAILKIKHFDKYVQSAARQAVNAERAMVIAKETGGNNGNRDYNTTGEKSELQKNMEFALS